MAASNLLSDKAILAALKAPKAAGKATKHADGEGLHLEARPTGAGWWRFRYRFAGKEQMPQLFPGTQGISRPTILTGAARPG